MKKVTIIVLGIFLTGMAHAQWNYNYANQFRLSINTSPADSIGPDSAVVGGSYRVDGHISGSDEHVHAVIQWSRRSNDFPPPSYQPTDSSKVLVYLHITGKNPFSTTISGLQPNTQYYYRALTLSGSRSDYKWAYGAQVPFKTLPADGSSQITNNSIYSVDQTFCSNGLDSLKFKIQTSTPIGGLPGDSTYTMQWLKSYTGRPNSWFIINQGSQFSDSIKLPIDSFKTTNYFRKVVSSGLQSDTTPPIEILVMNDSILSLNRGNLIVLSTLTDSIEFAAIPSHFSGDFKTQWQALDTTVNDQFQAINTTSVSQRMIPSSTGDSIWYRAIISYDSAGIYQCPMDTTPIVSFSSADGSGHVYPITRIGTQHWMIQNLRSTIDQNGNAIEKIITPSEWARTDSAAYSWNKNNSIDSINLGALYNQYVINLHGDSICPVGWRIPKVEDWQLLVQNSGGYLKAGANISTTNSASSSSNSTNFNGLLLGYRNGLDGNFQGRNVTATWWVSSNDSNSNYVSTYDSTSSLIISSRRANNELKRIGRSIRCMRYPDGGRLILGNTIDTQDSLLCALPTGKSRIRLTGSIPTGGLGGSFRYTWEVSPSNANGSWVKASNNDTSLHLTFIDSLNSSDTLYFRRKVRSGSQVVKSNVVQIRLNKQVHLDSSFVVIDQISGSKNELELRASIYNSYWQSNYYWFRGDTAHQASFNTIFHWDSLLTYTPDSNEHWIMVKALWQDSLNICHLSQSKVIGFTPADASGNVYPYTRMGGLDWMIVNLRNTKIDSSLGLVNASANATWSSITTPAYCWLSNDSASNNIQYGLLYNGYAIIDSVNLCPTGWYIPEYTEWQNFMTTRNQYTISQKLRVNYDWTAASNTTYLPGTNTLNFNATGGGYRLPDGQFASNQQVGTWWLGTLYNESASLLLSANNQNSMVAMNNSDDGSGHRFGRSLRCVHSPDGSVPIANNSILSKDSVFCSGLSSLSNLQIIGSTPTGGNPVGYNYQWQYSKTGKANTWLDLPGNDSSINYMIPDSFKLGTSYYYQRLVTSGFKRSLSRSIQLIFVDAGPANVIDVVNIKSLPASSPTVILESSSLPAQGGYTKWFASTSPDSNRVFSLIDSLSGKTMITLNAPNQIWYKSQVSYFDTTQNKCVDLQSPAIGFTPEDGDGNIYPYVKIDSILWMINNLRTTSYNDSTAINRVDTITVWKTDTNPAYSWYNNDSASNAFNYGAFYNYFVIADSNKNVCPVGWKVAEQPEWSLLLAKAGGKSVAASKIKTTYDWALKDTTKTFYPGTNLLNFNGLPAGYRYANSKDITNGYDFLRDRCLWWGVDLTSNTNYFQVYMVSFDPILNIKKRPLNLNTGTDGHSIRCTRKDP